ncbi:MAG: integrase DNA-binding domain-containing protein, partial [Lachnospiraceae bacterium]|nr:integrase DNA-binding domain-containing protein [Lachnospiraceae bacterium]
MKQVPDLLRRKEFSMDKRRDKKGRVLNKGEVQRADG